MVEVVAALVHDTENPRRFLICQRPAYKTRGLLWEFVGGKVEPGETKREALARECREELGVAVSVGDVYMELTHVYPDLTIHLTLFHAEITDGVPQLLEHCAMDWITPEEIGGYAEFIEANWIGRRTADCNGLIKGYGWLNPDTHEVEYGTNGMPDIGADTMYANASEKGTIDTIPEIPGLAVWHEGHIGIYIGNGEVIQAANTNAGVIRTPIGQTGWTHWLKIPYISYIEETEETNP